MSNLEQANEFKLKGNQFFKDKNWEEAIAMYTKAIEINPNDHIFYSNRSACYVQSNKLEESLNDAEKCINLYPEFITGYSRKGLALFRMGKLDEAQTAYEAGLKLDPNNKSLINGLNCVENEKKNTGGNTGAGNAGAGNAGMNPMLMQLFQHPKFMEYMKEPSFQAIFSEIQQDPNNLMKHLNDPRVQDLMSIFMPKDQNANTNPNPESNNNQNNNTGETKKGETKKEETKKENSQNSYKSKGDTCYRSKNYNEAIENYNLAIKEDENNVLIYNNIAACYIQLKNYDESEKSIDKALEIYSSLSFSNRKVEDFAKLNTRKARIYELRGNLEEAINYVKKADLEYKLKDNYDYLRKLKKLKIKKEKDDYINLDLSEKHRELGNNLFRDGKFKESIEEYEEASKRNPKDAKVYNNLALVYIKIMRFDLAMDHVNKALELEPSLINALIRKGKIHNGLKEYHKAIDLFESILKKQDLDDKSRNNVQFLLNETKAKIQSSMNQGNDEERMQRAMSDPEIQSIVQDPMVKLALQKIQENPQCAMEYFNDSNMGPKLQKLIAAGIIKTG